MPKESEITPFSGSSSSSRSATPGKAERLRRVANTLKWGGLAGFWIQVSLGVVSAVTLALAIINPIETKSQAGISFSIFCAVCGLICLIVAICIAFRYNKMAGQFIRPTSTPPKKSTTIKIVQIGLMTSLVGTFLTILGVETIAGIVLSKTLVLGQGEVFTSKGKEYVNSLDIFIIQACINIIAAHFAGIVSSLWILSRIDK
jgi:hypothetical protein